MTTDPKKASSNHDWSALDAMTEEERHAAAVSDPDAQPLTEEDMNRMKRLPRAFSIRRAFKLTQEEFAERFRIPLGTLRDWEQGKTEPDAVAQAYLHVVAHDPKAVMRAFGLESG